MILVIYRNGVTQTVLEVDKPPEDVLEFARERIWPNVQVPEVDAKWERAHAEWSK